ncbi:hypothetical protein scyTo_0002443 [Scyliorhinus torazame]|uniref:Uncharacterized protein n=1 Tax=Scyliorhinus torazame TaxID=75743 RepID=A0A401PJI6_SCYTO|nr:hypothetical protein [Scyliorhinus torazame]
MEINKAHAKIRFDAFKTVNRIGANSQKWYGAKPQGTIGTLLQILPHQEYKDAEEDEPIPKLPSATVRMDTNHWIAFSVKNTVAKPLNQKTANTSAAKESPEHKRKGSPYGQ